MAQYDPALRRVTKVFQRTRIEARNGKMCYKPAGFQYVEYDGSPDRELEPINMVERFHDIDNRFGNPVVPETDGTMIAGVEFIDSGIVNEVHRFDPF